MKADSFCPHSSLLRHQLQQCNLDSEDAACSAAYGVQAFAMLRTIRWPHPGFYAEKRTIRGFGPDDETVPGRVSVAIAQYTNADVLFAAVGAKYGSVSFEAGIDSVDVRRVAKGVFFYSSSY